MSNCKGRRQDGVYNCFGIYDNSMCYKCIHKEASEAKEKSNKFVSFRDKVDELYKFLKGEELPEGTECKMPKLPSKRAFAVIWFLQEHLHVLPSNIEQCDSCKELFDTDSSGSYGGDDDDDTEHKKKYHGKFFCDNCIPEDFLMNINSIW